MSIGVFMVPFLCQRLWVLLSPVFGGFVRSVNISYISKSGFIILLSTSSINPSVNDGSRATKLSHEKQEQMIKYIGYLNS